MQVLVVTTFFLARFGYGGLPVSFGEGLELKRYFLETHPALRSPDLLWLGCITTGLYIIIVPAVILAQIGAHDMPLMIVSSILKIQNWICDFRMSCGLWLVASFTLS